jgi:hypothetical protein
VSNVRTVDSVVHKTQYNGNLPSLCLRPSTAVRAALRSFRAARLIVFFSRPRCHSDKRSGRRALCQRYNDRAG